MFGESKTLATPTEYMSERKLAQEVATTICNKQLNSDQLAKLFPEAEKLKLNPDLMKIIFNSISSKRYVLKLGTIGGTGDDSSEKVRKSACIDSHFDAIPFLTSAINSSSSSVDKVEGKVSDSLMNELIDSLILNNFDGLNSDAIQKLTRNYSLEEISSTIIFAIDVLNSIDLDDDVDEEENRQSTSTSGEEEKEDVNFRRIDGYNLVNTIKGINYSLIPLLVSKRYPNIPANYAANFLIEDLKESSSPASSNLADILLDRIEVLKRASQRYLND
jgi:hypothetical protein